jgi:hypothetical protein
VANNTTLNSGTGGDVMRDIDRAGVKTPVALLDTGGTASEQIVSEDAPLTVRSVVDVFDVTLTLDTSIYADGDILADTQSVGTVFLNSGGGRTLMSVHVLDEDDQGQGFDLIFLDANTSLGTENSAPSITDANARGIIGRVAISSADFYDIGGSRIATRTGINLPMQGNASSTLYVAAISRGTGTYSANGVRLKLGFV